MGETAYTPPDTEIVLPVPRVTLWRLLIEPYRIPTTRDSGVVIPDEVESRSKWLTIVGRVIAMGEQAFKSEKLRDSGNPGVGDWVVYGQYAGQRIDMADGRQFVILDDADILCVVTDPSQLRHAYV